MRSDLGTPANSRLPPIPLGRIDRCVGITRRGLVGPDPTHSPSTSIAKSARQSPILGHAALDEAVLAAYGFPAKQDLLQQLLDLNHEVAARIERGVPERPRRFGIA